MVFNYAKLKPFVICVAATFLTALGDILEEVEKHEFPMATLIAKALKIGIKPVSFFDRNIKLNFFMVTVFESLIS